MSLSLCASTICMLRSSCESFLLFLSPQVYDPELAKKIDDFVDQLKNLLQVEKPFTLVRDGALLVIHS